MSAQRKAQESPYKFDVSILVPMYNEQETIVFVLNKIKSAMGDRSYEIVVVDDGSSDDSYQEVQTFMAINPKIPMSCHYQGNKGKGGAIRTAIERAQGEILVVQDADLEYEPNDIIPLLVPFEKGEICVYGSRNMIKEGREHSSLFFYWGGLLVTHATNILFGSNLTDEATGYKLFHASLFKQLSFKQNDFSWEPEVTAKMLKRKINIIEMPISYKPRSKAEGKKISWVDGVKAIYILVAERLKK